MDQDDPLFSKPRGQLRGSRAGPLAGAGCLGVSRRAQKMLSAPSLGAGRSLRVPYRLLLAAWVKLVSPAYGVKEQGEVQELPPPCPSA